MTRGRRSGLTLLEVLVALTLLGLGAAAWTGLAGQGMHSIQRGHARELELLRASQAMSRISLWPRERIEALGGNGIVWGFRVGMEPLTPSLYRVTIADSAGGAELLRTSLYVRAAAHASP